MREACGGCVSSAKHRSEAQPAARRPCLHERSETQARTRPKKYQKIIPRFVISYSILSMSLLSK
ncbi:MAG: hypothetical protein NZ455_00285 [Bacteroidia bacterium]|nr:hypothetical protein [Bacteroidia bacterium]